MAGKVEQRRAILRERLIDISERTIAQNGLHSLKARDIAKEANCATGAIYTHFKDLQDLIMEVNARTFRSLGTERDKGRTQRSALGPECAIGHNVPCVSRLRGGTHKSVARVVRSGNVDRWHCTNLVLAGNWPLCLS